MKSLVDPLHALSAHLDDLRRDLQLPSSFPIEVLEAAEAAARRVPSDHVDHSARPFVTLDPATSTDLDQAFAIERSGADLLLFYAIADVGWFVDDGGAIDREAWKRGATQYLPDGKVPLYPPAIGERAASLLPDGPRPAVLFTVRVDPAGESNLDGVERAIIHSRAKLAYDKVSDADLPADFAELARRIQSAEQERGAVRVDPPEQEVARSDDGRFALVFRQRLLSEDRNAALSLATNLAVAKQLAGYETGLFRIMAEPDERAEQRLRHSAAALGLDWPPSLDLAEFQRGLDPSDDRQASLMMAIRRAGQGASYAPWRSGTRPWHAAMAATYVHATAPLRRLADRYVVGASLALGRGQPVSPIARQAFEALPAVMARADALAGRVERGAVDLAEALILSSRIGESFAAVATDKDERGVRIQLRDLPVVARLAADDVSPGKPLTVRLIAADPTSRTIRFDRIID